MNTLIRKYNDRTNTVATIVHAPMFERVTVETKKAPRQVPRAFLVAAIAAAVLAAGCATSAPIDCITDIECERVTGISY